MFAALPSATAATTTPTTTPVGVTRTTVTVGGLVGADAASTGAEIGAQARFARANRGRGVAGRTVEYAGNAADTAAAAATVFAVVPAVSDTLDTATLAQASVPFVGSASTTGWDANRFGFGFVGAEAALQTKVASPAWGAQLRSLLGTAQGSKVNLAVDDSELGPRPRHAGGSVVAGCGVPAGRRSLRAGTARTVAGSRADRAAARDRQPGGRARADVTAGDHGDRAAAGGSGVHRHRRHRRVDVPAAGTGRRRAGSPCSCPTPRSSRPPPPTVASPPTSRRSCPAPRSRRGSSPGYWSADLFVQMLAKTGTRLTRERFLAVAAAVPVRGAVDDRPLDVAGDAHAGRAVWRARAERRHAVDRGRALRVRHADRGEAAEAVGGDHDQGLTGSAGLGQSFRPRGGNRPSSSPGTTRCRRSFIAPRCR